MIYWLILTLMIATVFLLKKESKFYLMAAFYLYVFGALIRITGLNVISEVLMRIDLLLWIIGLVKAYKELS